MTARSDVAVAPSRATTDEWRKCPSCGAYLYHKRLRRHLGVCPECNHHLRLRLRERLAQLLDEEGFEDLGGDLESADPLGFVDTTPYRERLARAQRATGTRTGALVGRGTLGGHPVVVAGIEFDFIGGSMGGAVGEAITRAAELALAERAPLLVISASGGARMQEGAISLMQMVKTSQAVAALREAGVLYVSLLTDPTYGGVSASFATLGDVLIAEPGAHIGFAGPSVIEQTIRQSLPPGFQTAEFLLEHGLIDLVTPRESLRSVLRRIVALHSGAEAARSASPAALLPRSEGAAAVTEPERLRVRDPWDVVQVARAQERPKTLDLAALVFDDFHELHGDRASADDKAIVGGLAALGGLTVMLIGHQKGSSTSEMIERNFGMPGPQGYRKALRLMRYAARFGLPLLTLVDTPGAYPGVAAEEGGQSGAIAECILEMSRLPIPTVATVTGEGGSGGALALAAADRVLMLESSYYSVISPEGCATILFKDATAAPRAAAALRLTAPDLLRLGIVDAVVPEPEGGAHTDHVATADNVRAALLAALRELVAVAPRDLLARRYERFRRYGAPQPTPGLLADSHDG